MPNTWDTRTFDEYFYPLFSQIWSNESDFETDYKNSGLYATNNKISDDGVNTLYYMLYASYANSPIAFTDVNQFKYNVYLTIFRYGPTWEKELDIQNRIRNLSDNELRKGSIQIYNNANNPSTPIIGIQPQSEVESANQATPIVIEEGTLSDKQIGYINNQSVTLNEKGVLDGYAYLLDLLKTDVTGEFIKKFKPYFLACLSRQKQPIYISEEN